MERLRLQHAIRGRHVGNAGAFAPVAARFQYVTKNVAALTSFPQPCSVTEIVDWSRIQEVSGRDCAGDLM
jgi:hypothetical protein